MVLTRRPEYSTLQYYHLSNPPHVFPRAERVFYSQRLVQFDGLYKP